MTDNEIIKALECHTGNNSKRCQVCPYTIYGYYCLEHLYPDLLNLINRQKSKIKEFDEKIVIQLGMIDYQKAEIDKLNVELVGMRGACESYKMHYDNAQAEIERLQKKVNYLKDVNKRNDVHLHVRLVEQAKSEAIKEFAERLKEKLQWDVEFDNKLVFESDIDNLVKEMTEES